MMPAYRDKTNTVLRDTIHAALGIPYLREEDINHVPEDLHSIFDHIEEDDPETFTFLANFVDNYIEGYWLAEWNHSELSFWGDLSHFSSEHMSNNALESYNNELYTLLGRQPHPNPYKFVCTLKRALSTTKRVLGWVERGEYEEVRSKNAKRAIDKRQRLKVQYMNRLKRSANKIQQRIARLKYMKATGSTNTRILAKGKRKVAKKAQKFNKSVLETSVKMGRPSYKRVKAPQQKKCRFCGKIFKSKGGCTNHENDCKLSGSTLKQNKCDTCSKSFKSKLWFRRHEEKSHSVQNQESVNIRRKSSYMSSSETNTSMGSDESNDISRSISIDSLEVHLGPDKDRSGTESDSTNSSNKSDSETNPTNVNTSTFNLEENLTIIKENQSEKEILEIPSESIMETDARNVMLSLTTLSGKIGERSRLILSSWKKIVRQTIEANQKLYEIVDKLSETLNEEILESLLKELIFLPVSASGLVGSGVGKVLLPLRKQSGEVGLLANQVHVKWVEHITTIPSGHLPKRKVN